MNGKNSRDVKTISMMDKKLTKEITPVKIILDTDNEIRATNFYVKKQKTLHLPSDSIYEGNRKTKDR